MPARSVRYTSLRTVSTSLHMRKTFQFRFSIQWSVYICPIELRKGLKHPLQSESDLFHSDCRGYMWLFSFWEFLTELLVVWLQLDY